MLSACLSTTLAEPIDERHAWQTEMVQWVGSALAGVQATLAQKVLDSQARLEEVSCEQNALSKELSEGEEKLATLKDAFQWCESKAAEGAAALQADEKLLKDANIAAAAMDTELTELVCLKSELGATMAEGGSYIRWKSTEAATEDANAFTSFMKKHDFEAGLVQTLPLVLMKPPAERSEFALMVMSQFEVAMEKMIAGVAEKQASSTASRAENVEVVAAAEASLESADAELCSAQASEQEARALVKHGEVDVKKAKRALKDLASSMKDAQAAEQAASAISTHFQEAPMATFKELDERSAIKLLEIETTDMDIEHETNDVQLPTDKHQATELQLPTDKDQAIELQLPTEKHQPTELQLPTEKHQANALQLCTERCGS